MLFTRATSSPASSMFGGIRSTPSAWCRMPSPGWMGWSFMAFCIRVENGGGQFIGLLPAHADGQAALWVSVHQQNFFALHRQPDAQIFTGGAFPHTAFLIGDCDNRSFLCDNITPLSENRAQSRSSSCSDSRGSWWWAHCRALPADTCFMFRTGAVFSARQPSTKRIWSAFSFLNRLRTTSAGLSSPAIRNILRLVEQVSTSKSTIW